MNGNAAAYTLPALIGFKGICAAEPFAWTAVAVPLFIAYHVIISKFSTANDKK